MIGAKELSKKNQWYIPKYRYLELKNYCLQYEDWVTETCTLHTRTSIDLGRPEKYILNVDNIRTIESYMVKMQWYYKQIALVKRALALTSGQMISLSTLLYGGVVKNQSYDVQVAKDPILCVITRHEYYDAYRQFFYILDKMRKEQDNETN